MLWFPVTWPIKMIICFILCKKVTIEYFFGLITVYFMFYNSEKLNNQQHDLPPFFNSMRMFWPVLESTRYTMYCITNYVVELVGPNIRQTVKYLFSKTPLHGTIKLIVLAPRHNVLAYFVKVFSQFLSFFRNHFCSGRRSISRSLPQKPSH